MTAYEVEPRLNEYLATTVEGCRALCEQSGIDFAFELRAEDFVRAGVNMLQSNGLFSACRQEFTAAVLNPPYRKINTDSETRRLLSMVGVETTNLYTAFLWLAMKLLDEDADLVAITPRSFCNGPYFRPFRLAMIESWSFRRIHVFDARDRAFSDDEVLQENIIFHAVKTKRRTPVTVSSSTTADDANLVSRTVQADHLVQPDDPAAFIHIAPNEWDQLIAQRVRSLDASLADLGLMVSTGRVVAFRARPLIRAESGPDTVPLIYPAHLSAGYVAWPNPKCRKPSALTLGPGANDLLIPADFYVLTKRFSAKEERRRVVAAIYDPNRLPAERVAFENHLNYFHRNGRGLTPELARGLAAFLNSTMVDQYFRQFNGHTQVNATDLRSLRYPSTTRLEALGARLTDGFPDQDELDRQVQEELFGMAKNTRRDPVRAKKLIKQALEALKALNVPREQQNERSALTLLALLDMKPATPWTNAADPMRGITEMMDYFREHFRKKYAPNTRETVRRFTIHQFVQVGLVLANPDDPDRPVNSPDNRYQIEASALKLMRTFGTPDWDTSLTAYLATADALRRLHPREREMKLIPVALPDGTNLTLSAGGQNVLVKDIIEKFCPRFTPGAKLVYLGDTGAKRRYYDEEHFRTLGVTIDEHGKMPDIVVHDTIRNWLILIEAVTSHGPVSLKRHNELKELFRGASAGLVFVTAFMTRKAMVKYLSDIAWETEVWIAESPSHLIHFNGERFLGPYSSSPYKA